MWRNPGVLDYMRQAGQDMAALEEAFIEYVLQSCGQCATSLWLVQSMHSLVLLLQSNPEVLDYMRQAGLKDMAALEAAFEERVLNLASSAGRAYIIWQDVVDNGVKVRTSKP